MIFKRNIFVILSLHFSVIICNPSISAGYGETNTIGHSFPRWISQEKIRAGYLYAKDNTRYAGLMHTYGLNTVIIKGDYHQKDKLAKMMVDADMKIAERERILKDHGKE